MRDVERRIKERAAALLESGEVKRVLAWKKGEFCFDPEPAFFENVEAVGELVYNGFCGANLSKYLIEANKKEGKTAVFLKPCDTYSLNQLLKEHRVDREKVYAIGISCEGNIDIRKIKGRGISAITDVEEGEETLFVSTLYGTDEVKREEVLLARCYDCKGKTHRIADETILSEKDKKGENKESKTPSDRFSEVRKIEQMTADERFKFWQGELSRCIRCNACRNVCPACSCIKCVFDNPTSGVAAKANDTPVEEQLFHIIRAYHVSGRCTDCGECSRVCPQSIPLHLLNRKFIKDINEHYGEFQAGESADGKTPYTEYSADDPEPKTVLKSEGKHV